MDITCRSIKTRPAEYQNRLKKGVLTYSTLASSTFVKPRFRQPSTFVTLPSYMKLSNGSLIMLESTKPQNPPVKVTVIFLLTNQVTVLFLLFLICRRSLIFCVVYVS